MSSSREVVFKAVVAMNKQRVIGINQNIPWHIPQDLQHFRALTLNRVLLMGHDTYKSIGKALDNRTTIVLSRDPGLILTDALVVNGKQEALEMATKMLNYHTLKEVMVVGGSQIYRLFMDKVSVIHQTVINNDVTGDHLFPPTPDFNTTLLRKKTAEGKDHRGQAQIFHLSYKTLVRKTQTSGFKG